MKTFVFGPGDGGGGKLAGMLAQALGGGSDDDTPDSNDASHAANLDRVAREMRREENESPDIAARVLIDMLAAHQARIASGPRFKVGDLVQAVSSSPYRFWTPKRPGIVVEMLAEPVFETGAESTSPSFRLPLDMRVGSIRGGEFMIWHVHSLFFEPYTGPVA